MRCHFGPQGQIYISGISELQEIIGNEDLTATSSQVHIRYFVYDGERSMGTSRFKNNLARKGVQCVPLPKWVSISPYSDWIGIFLDDMRGRSGEVLVADYLFWSSLCATFGIDLLVYIILSIVIAALSWYWYRFYEQRSARELLLTVSYCCDTFDS